MGFSPFSNLLSMKARETFLILLNLRTLKSFFQIFQIFSFFFYRFCPFIKSFLFWRSIFCSGCLSEMLLVLLFLLKPFFAPEYLIVYSRQRISPNKDFITEYAQIHIFPKNNFRSKNIYL